MFLQQELVNRCGKNPKYSLRSFARSLAIDPSSLSRLLRGDRVLTRAMLHRLANRVGLEPDVVDRFENSQFQTPDTRPEGRSPRPFINLSMDAFRVIADWYHFAILELSGIKGFDSNPRWIAKRLGITVSEVNLAVERLGRLKLLNVRHDGSWDTLNHTTLGHPTSDVALRKLQRQILEQAIRALEETSLEHRDQTCMTMAVSSRRLKEAKIRIRKFRRELSDFLEAGRPKDAVYQLAIALFPITDPNFKEDSK